MTARLSITNFSLCRDCSEHAHLSDFETCVCVIYRTENENENLFNEGIPGREVVHTVNTQ